MTDDFVQLQLAPSSSAGGVESMADVTIRRISEAQNMQEESQRFLAKMLMVCGICMMMLSIILFAVQDDGYSTKTAEKLILSCFGIFITICGFKIMWPNNDMNPLQEFASLWRNARAERTHSNEKGSDLGVFVEEHVFKRFDELADDIKTKHKHKQMQTAIE